MFRLLSLFPLLSSLCMVAPAVAQDLTHVVIADGNYNVLGGTTVTRQSALPAGYTPVNVQVAFVYDPEFHFFMRGYLTEPAFDKRAAYADVGFVVVAAAGDPGGYYRSAPDWITHQGFSAAVEGDSVDVRYAYGASYVPTRRGFQSFVVYVNLAKVDAAASLYVYDDALTFGRGNYLITGDGPEAAVELHLFSEDAAAEGNAGIEVHTTRETAGSHWKLMLFANGSAAGFDGIDLTAYDKLAFYARANRNVTLQGGFGTGDDTGSAQASFALTSEFQRFEVDLAELDRTDVNTPFWVFLHKAHSAVDFTDLRVYLDAIELVAAD